MSTSFRWETTSALASRRAEVICAPASSTPQIQLTTCSVKSWRHVILPAHHHRRPKCHPQKRDVLQAHICRTALRGQGAFSSSLCNSLLKATDNDTASDEVYLATIDLDVPAGPPRWFAAAGKRLLPSLFRHSMTIIKTTSGQVLFGHCSASDPSIARTSAALHDY